MKIPTAKKKLLLISLAVLILLYLLFPIWPLRIVDPQSVVGSMIPKDELIRLARESSPSRPAACLSVIVMPVSAGGMDSGKWHYILYFRQLIPALDRALLFSSDGADDVPPYAVRPDGEAADYAPYTVRPATEAERARFRYW